MDIFTDSKDTGFVALGYNNEINYIWSNFKQDIFKLKSADLKPNNLRNILGDEYIYTNYQDIDLKGNNSINYSGLVSDIINQCQKAGVYNIDKQRGAGIWKDLNGELVVNTKKIFSTNKSFDGSRIQKDGVYIFSKDLGITSTTEQADNKDIDTAFNILKSFNWTRGEQDAKLFFGWILHSYVTGALKWRSHSYVSGEGGAGKSTLQKFVSFMLNKNSILIDGASTEAGIRQKIGNNSCAVLVDESEASERKMLSILNMFRSASSSSVVLRGTSDGAGQDFKLQFCGLLTGIVPLYFNQADNGRYLKLELQPITDKSKILKEMFDEEFINSLGERLQMFMIKNFKKLEAINKIVHYEMAKNNSERYADTFGVLISSSYLVLHNDTTEENIKKYVSEFDFSDEKERSTHKDHDEALETLLSREVIDSDGKNKTSLINYIYDAYYKFSVQNDKKEFIKANGELSKFGIRVLDKDTLNILIDCSRTGLRGLFKDSRFEYGDISKVLQRVSNCTVHKEPKQIAGLQKRGCLEIKLDDTKYNFSKFAELRGIVYK